MKYIKNGKIVLDGTIKEQDLGESTEINYADKNDTYTKNQVYKKTQTYNKTEVNALLQEIWDYIRPEEEEEEQNG